MTLSDDTEIVFEQKIVEMAHLFGWKVASFRPGGSKKGFRTPVKYDGKGYVDLTLVHPARGCVIFAEIKRDRGMVMSPEQGDWGEWITQCAVRSGTDAIRYRLWQPRNGNDIISELSFDRVKEWRP